MSITDFQVDSLFTGDPEKYRVRFSKDTGSGYEVKLLHKFLPNQYTTEYKAPPYAASFVSVDGTAKLKGIAFGDGAIRSSNGFSGWPCSFYIGCPRTF